MIIYEDFTGYYHTYNSKCNQIVLYSWLETRTRCKLTEDAQIR